MLNGLKYCGTQSVPQNNHEIRLFCIVQNEELRLPDFLRHYRQLGVARFFFVDNNSTDDTAKFLATQNDVHVFSAAGSFLGAGFGVDWHNQLLKTYGSDHWCVIADADELFVYPDCEAVSLPQFCARLETCGYTALQAVLLDMYSDKPMANLGYHSGDALLQACPYFDRDYQFVKRHGLPWQSPPFPAVEPIGGPRSRLFFPQQYHASGWRRFAIKSLFRLFKPLADRGWLHSGQIPHPEPQLFKIPLIKWQPDFTMITPHRMNKVPLAQASGALLHFKFLDDFAARTVAAIKHGQHYGGNIEYQRYGALLSSNPTLTFMYAGSQRYKSSQDLVRAGIIQPLGQDGDADNEEDDCCPVRPDAANAA